MENHALHFLAGQEIGFELKCAKEKGKKIQYCVSLFAPKVQQVL